jgi:adenylyltransferase/sulfurtransferase
VIQATETVKLIMGIGESLVGRLVRYDALEMRFREYKVRRDPECPVCGDHPTIRKLIDYQQFCGIPQQVTTRGELDVTEVKQKIDRGDDFLLIDVREPHEYQIACIPTAKLIPLGEVAKRLNEIDPDAEIVVHCKSGGRSARAVEILRQNGYKNVANMRGGILAWSEKVDPRVPKY